MVVRKQDPRYYVYFSLDLLSIKCTKILCKK